MKKVLLVNRNKCSNIGDQAIHKSFKNFLTHHFDVDLYEADYTSTSKEAAKLNVSKRSFSIFLRKIIKKVLPLNLIWLLRNYSRINRLYMEVNPDLVIIGGGQLLLPGRFSIAAYLWVKLAKINNCKIVFSNIGIGGKFNYFDMSLVKLAINNCDGINLRDIDSEILLKRILSNKKNVSLSSDIVFTNYQKLKFNGEDSTEILVGVPALEVYNEYNKKISRIQYFELWMAYLKNLNIPLDKIHLIYTTSEDYNESLAFKGYILDSFKVEILLKKYDALRGFESCLTSKPFVISGRMHALIIALNHGCQVEVFPISPKLISFKNQIKETNLELLSELATSETKKFLSRYLNPSYDCLDSTHKCNV